MPLTAQVTKGLVEASRRKDWAHKAGYRSLSTFPWHCWLLTPETNEVEESQPGALNLASGHWQPRSPCKKKRGATLYSDNVGQAKKGIFVGLMNPATCNMDSWFRSGRGGIGRRACFRYMCLRVWEFKSPRPHNHNDEMAAPAVSSLIWRYFML